MSPYCQSGVGFSAGHNRNRHRSRTLPPALQSSSAARQRLLYSQGLWVQLAEPSYPGNLRKNQKLDPKEIETFAHSSTNWNKQQEQIARTNSSTNSSKHKSNKTGWVSRCSCGKLAANSASPNSHHCSIGLNRLSYLDDPRCS